MVKVDKIKVEVESPKIFKRKYGYEYRFKTAEGFYYTLLNFNDMMAKGLLRYEPESHLSTRWIFRGHWKSNWRLLPNAFRNKWYRKFRAQPIGYFTMLTNLWRGYKKNKTIDESQYRIIPQINTEYYLLRRFIDTANDLGINCNYIDSSHDNYTKNPKEWPNNNIWPAMALAQHHRFPTRLLDFTYNPLLAAFFAAFHPFEKKLAKKLWSKYLCVWAIDEGNISRNSLKKIPLPINRSSNIFAQEGVLILDPNANERFIKNKGKWQDLIAVKKKGSFIKITLPQKQCKELLRRLLQDNITPARLMPNLDSVTQTLEYVEWLQNRRAYPMTKLFEKILKGYPKKKPLTPSKKTSKHAK